MKPAKALSQEIAHLKCYVGFSSKSCPLCKLKKAIKAKSKRLREARKFIAVLKAQVALAEERAESWRDREKADWEIDS